MSMPRAATSVATRMRSLPARMRAIAVMPVGDMPAAELPADALHIDGSTLLGGLVAARPPDFDPEAQPTSVLLRTRAVSCNYRDRGLLRQVALRAAPGSFYVIGSEFVGEVLAVGRGVETLAPGDRVVARGFLGLTPGLKVEPVAPSTAGAGG